MKLVYIDKLKRFDGDRPSDWEITGPSGLEEPEDLPGPIYFSLDDQEVRAHTRPRRNAPVPARYRD